MDVHPGVHPTSLGQIFGKDEDEANAFHYHLESHKFYPVNLDVISWLGVWFVKNQIYEKVTECYFCIDSPNMHACCLRGTDTLLALTCRIGALCRP